MSKMSRFAVRTAAGVGVGAMVSAATFFGAAGIAGASGPTPSTEVPGAATPIGSYTPGTPYSSGQTLQITIPANSNLTPGTLKVTECEAGPGGTVPATPSACDGWALDPNGTINSDGSVNYNDFEVLALPDVVGGEDASAPVICNATTACVLYIGDNQTTFTAPHYFSTPFYVTPNSDDGGESPGDGSANPGSGLPESPLAIGLPVLGAAIAGGVIVRRRRRTVNA